ncbi:hypothetical protein ACFSL4_33675 [Streptomyces caeni]|uniref:ABC transporter permease n=1 Tax=Streptomyces caeni TaxID=2307231 RepID=A0ABW4J0C5_9ACTN
MQRIGHAFRLSPRTLWLRTVWHRTWGTFTALLGVAVVLASAAALASVPSFTDDERSFLAAGPCPAGSSSSDCLRSVPATVRGTVIREGTRTSEYTLELAGPRSVPSEVDMASPEPLLKHLHRGDAVSVTLWRDYATAVSRDGVTQQTNDTPVDEPVYVAALALALLSVGIFGAHAGGVAALRARRHALRGLPPALVTRGKQAIGAALCAIPAGMVGALTNALGTIVLWAVLVGPVCWLIQRLETQHAGRHARYSAAAC